VTNALKPAAVACRDGTRFAVESVGGALVVTTPAADPARETAGLAPFEAAVQVRAGVFRHNAVPIDVVRAFIRAHGGYADAGPEALAALQSAGRPAEPAPAPAAEDVQGGGEAAPDRPFREGLPTPRLPPGSLPGITVCVVPGA
jgi:hypothetical protein